MRKIFNIEVTDADFDILIHEQSIGKDLKIKDGKVIAVEHVQTEEEILSSLRYQRETECFSITNRGQVWYDTLTEQQKEELKVWYQAWLDVTETKIIPEKPTWLK